MSSAGDAIEAFLGKAGFDRGPWLTVAFCAGIAGWFITDGPGQWVSIIALAIIAALGAIILLGGREERSHLRLAIISIALLVAAGVAIIWARSEFVGARALDAPVVARVDAFVLERIEQPAHARVRLVLATRHPDSAEPIKVRVNLPQERDDRALVEGSTIRLRVRLMPPASPMLPGGYDFARAAWFQGFAATGSVLGEVQILDQGKKTGSIEALQRTLSGHVRSQLGGSPGSIAAALASGDRGAISPADEEAMRDSGLTHLLSISGLHVSALIAAAYLLSIKLLALSPWLALRIRLPLASAAISAMAGIAYTLLTGAEVPTVRSCIGALLVLGALAIGREPLSLRMVAVAAFIVLILWPESLVGPSFQMSFSAVIAIVVLHGSRPVRDFLAPREESWAARFGRRVFMLLLTGAVIELALMPIVMFHFHRAGVYGALANVMAIPLTTFVSMPLIASALVFDILGAGAPLWWLAGKSLEFLLFIAHWFSAQPGAVKLMPSMGLGVFSLFLTGSLWLALWRGWPRLLGFLPVSLASVLAIAEPAPDILISGDGRHVGISGEGEGFLVLRETRSDFAKDNLLELSGMDGQVVLLSQWKGAQCSRDFCVVTLNRGRRTWHLLLARTDSYIEERKLAAACDMVDIVVADRWLPRSCRPKWLKADRNMLAQTGGLMVDLSDKTYRTVADGQGNHGWWRGKEP